MSKPQSYEFGGPIGTFLNCILLPPFVLILSHWTHVGYVDLQPFSDMELLKSILLPHTSMVTYLHCAVALFLWFVGLVVLWMILPGKVVQGTEIKTTGATGVHLEYRLNAHVTFWFVVGMVVAQPPLHLLYDHFDVLAWCANLWTIAMSLYFYLGSFGEGRILSQIGNSGYPTYDSWMGRELNPRLQLPGSSLALDWKQFCELRPGLMLWMLINLGCLQAQLRETGSVSASMILLNLAQAFYVWDGLYQERAILTTMDITTDGFGFMLCFGDLAWVPFTYTIPAKYLVHHDPQLSWYWLAGIAAVYALGFYIFRSANGQKDVFRRDPNHPSVAKLSYLQTKRGTRLLTSGWWGRARKVNYTGDWIMGLTYSLVCGVDSLVPYYYAVYFAVLLIHRSTRDDEMCHAKYGDDWLEYKRQVPYRFIPGIL